MSLLPQTCIFYRDNSMLSVAYDEYDSVCAAISRRDKFWSGRDEHGEYCFISLKRVVQVFQQSTASREAAIADKRKASRLLEGSF